jgi:hypothetical protein
LGLGKLGAVGVVASDDGSWTTMWFLIDVTNTSNEHPISPRPPSPLQFIFWIFKPSIIII